MQNQLLKSILILLIWYFTWKILDEIISKYKILNENILIISIFGIILTLGILYVLYNQRYF